LIGLAGVAVLALIGISVPAWAQQSENNALHAVPPPDKVVVDGKLNEWDLSGQIEVFVQVTF
jgi:hypothetical protein